MAERAGTEEVKAGKKLDETAEAEPSKKQPEATTGACHLYPVFDVVPHSLFEPTSYRTGVK